MNDNTVPHDRLIAAHTEAQRFYRQQLLTTPVAHGPCHYLAQRGFAHVLSPASIWQVGYAPARWTDLRDHLSRHGFEPEELLAAGLVCRTRRGGVVDRFRDRIMFPQRGVPGHVVGFIGRAAPGAPIDVPKYLNSPQTPIYHKGESLFGLHEQREMIAAGHPPVLVEGPLDVLAIAASTADGSAAAIAPCGTALTEQHVELVARHTPRGADIVVAYDNDQSGRRATAAAFERLVEGIDTSHALFAASLPRGADPAELLQIHGQAALRSALAGWSLSPLAERAIDARIETWAPVLDGIDGRIAAVKAVAPLFGKLPKTDVAQQLIRLAGQVNLDPVTVGIAVTDAVTSRPSCLNGSRTRNGLHKPASGQPLPGRRDPPSLLS